VETRPQRVQPLLAQASARLIAAGSETARLDAEVLLAHVLGVDRSTLSAHPEAVLTTGQLDAFEHHLGRRETGEPVAYIRGLKEFYGVAVTVDPRVLIPRPETEAIVELALARITGTLTAAPRAAGTRPYRVWDVGTGSGAIPLAIASELRRRRYGDAVRYLATDISAEARAVATINVVSHGLADLFDFAEGDLVDVTPATADPVDLLTANLPYVPSDALPGLPVAASFEPALALDGGPDGLHVIRRLLPRLPDVLVPGGVALLEIGGDQGERLTAEASTALPGWRCTIHPDLSGSPRVAQLERITAEDARPSRPGRAPLLRADDPASLNAAALAMDAGGIVGIPTETVYGLGVVPRPAPLAALIAAKGRADDKGIALLIDGLDQVEGLVSLAPAAQRLAERFWPGALTIVLPLLRSELVPSAVTGGRDTLGLRIPDHPVPRALARRLGPIAVTSANRSGEPAAIVPEELLASVGHALALVLDDGPVRGGVASTVVSVDADGAWRLLRSGALEASDIAEALKGA
jgi:release factor-specific protein-(glutamine-N5) methyltransferase/tRNA threonylcarbamoyl adenosine modification protein (Sua5/YciO/YrdC/YwlC family)